MMRFLVFSGNHKGTKTLRFPYRRSRMKTRRLAALATVVVALMLGVSGVRLLKAQQQTTNWTAAEDHQNMMTQLGIKRLRPGPSGNESAPNHANYDEAIANPFPNLPEVLTLK